MPETIKTTEVRVGDRLRARSGVDMTVTRIDQQFFGRDEMVAFVEDSAQQLAAGGCTRAACARAAIGGRSTLTLCASMLGE
jgi:hypothetical protein